MKQLICCLLFFVSLFAHGQYFKDVLQIGYGRSEYLHDILEDDKGNRYIHGACNDSVEIAGVRFHIDTSTSNGAYDFLVHLSPLGDLVWAHFLKTSGSGHQMYFDPQGNIVIAGVFYGDLLYDGILRATALNHSDVYVMKLNTSGELIWCRSFEGTGFELLNGFNVDHYGNIGLNGYFFNGYIDADPGPGVHQLVPSGSGFSAGFIHKLDGNGNFVWSHAITGSGSSCRDLFIGEDGSFYSLGLFKGSVDFDPDPEGEFTLTQLPFSTYNGFVQKLSAAGDLEWALNLGGMAEYSQIHLCVDSQNDLLVLGNGYSSVLQKFRPDGTEIYNRLIGLNNVVTSDMAIDRDDNIYISGRYQDSLILAYPSSTSVLYLEEMLYNGFMEKINSAGNLVWAETLRGTGNTSMGDVAFGRDETIIVGGSFTHDAFFAEDVILELTSSGLTHSDVFVATYGQNTCADMDCELLLYPNPATDEVTIAASQALDGTRIFIADNSGRIVRELAGMEGYEAKIDVYDLQKGLYFVCVEINGSINALRLLKY